MLSCRACVCVQIHFYRKQLAFKAFDISHDKRADTPYSRAATEEFQVIYNGGKKDDITVIVALLDIV